MRHFNKYDNIPLRLLITIGFLTLLINTSFSQELTVLYGTPMTINGGTPFSVGGLVLNPSSDFTLNNISITKNEKVTNYLGQSTVARVYKFSSTTNPFIGEAGIRYQAQELSSGNYANLKLQVHNGNNWSVVPLKTIDINNHTTQSQVFSQSLNEIALTDNAFTPTLIIMGNPVTNGILKFAINADSDVSFYSFEGTLLWNKKYLTGKYSVEVPNLASGTYMLKANQLTQTVMIVK
jgi:hypothetical protein